jgi:hypothetical protein
MWILSFTSEACVTELAYGYHGISSMHRHTEAPQMKARKLHGKAVKGKVELDYWTHV